MVFGRKNGSGLSRPKCNLQNRTMHMHPVAGQETEVSLPRIKHFLEARFDLPTDGLK